MRIGEERASGSWLPRAFLVMLIVCSPRAFAAVHLVQFGGSVGLSYSPAFFTAAVGDTIRWQGSFEFHPLSSTSVPVGADSWQNGAGTTFDYVVRVPGTYNYHCDVHTPTMAASFSVVLTGLGSDEGEGAPASFRLEQNYPNPFNPATVISYRVPALSAVRLSVYDLQGREVAILVNAVKAPGVHEVRFDAAGLASGVYLYRLSARPADGGGAGNLLESKRMLIVK